MTRLSVNVNKIALLRNSRSGKGPDVLPLARIALEAGAAGITVHPRPDRRHITPADVRDLAALLAEPGWGDRELNIEGNPFEGDWLSVVAEVRPDQATLVPDTPGQATSDHGFTMPGDIERLVPVVSKLKGLGCRVSIFMDADAKQVRQVGATGADRVELYTEPYAEAFARRGEDPEGYRRVLGDFVTAAAAAGEARLAVNAGHDLTSENVSALVDAIGPDRLAEVSIGHALIGDALRWGMAETVRRYLAAIDHHATQIVILGNRNRL